MTSLPSLPFYNPTYSKKKRRRKNEEPENAKMLKIRGQPKRIGYTEAAMLRNGRMHAKCYGNIAIGAQSSADASLTSRARASEESPAHIASRKFHRDIWISNGRWWTRLSLHTAVSASFCKIYKSKRGLSRFSKAYKVLYFGFHKNKKVFEWHSWKYIKNTGMSIEICRNVFKNGFVKDKKRKI